MLIWTGETVKQSNQKLIQQSRWQMNEIRYIHVSRYDSNSIQPQA